MKSFTTLLFTIVLSGAVSFSQCTILMIDYNNSFSSDQDDNGSRIYNHLVFSQNNVVRVNSIPAFIDTLLYERVWLMGDMGLPVASNLDPIVNYMNAGGAVYVQSEIMCCDNQAAYIDSLINLVCIAGQSIDVVNNVFAFYQFEPLPTPCIPWLGHGNAARVYEGVPINNVLFSATGVCLFNMVAGDVVAVKFGPSDMISGRGALVSVGDMNLFPSGTSCSVIGLVDTPNDSALITFLANTMTSLLTGAPVSINAGCDVTICYGDSTTLKASSVTGTFIWSTGDDSASITVSPLTDATYYVSTGDTSCSETDTVIVTVIELNVAAGPDDTVCVGNSIVLTASGNASYVWNTGDTTASITVSPLVDTTYYVTVTDGICPPITDSVNISVLDSVIASVSPLAYVACVADTLTFTNSSNGINYYWNFGNGDTSTAVSPTYNYTTGGTYNGSLIATDLTSCNINDTVLFVVTITELTVDAGLNDTICAGDLTVLTASGGGNYLWSTGDTTASISVMPSIDTTYYVTATDSLCTSSDSVQVNVNHPPLSLAIMGDSTLCLGSILTLTAQGPAPYIWSTGETSDSITVSPTATTNYWVQTVNNCGISGDTVTVSVNLPPSLSISSDTSITLGEMATLTTTGAVSYLWNTGDTSNSISVNPTQTTIYTVTGTDSMGCSAEASVTVTIAIPAARTPLIYVPNVFSVMSDNIENKRLFVFGQNINSLVFTIYDRWGKKVYESQDASNKLRVDGECCAYTEGWDGTFRNSSKILNGSVFVYILKGEFEDGAAFNESGNITLIQ